MAIFDIEQIVQSLHGVRREWRDAQKRSQEPGGREFPSRDALAHVVEQLKGALFPMRLGPPDLRQESEDFYVAHTLDAALHTLHAQMVLELKYTHRHRPRDPQDVELLALKAAQDLVQRGFIVLPYVHADPVLCRQLEEAGCAAVMPLAAPIGSNRGLESRAFLEIVIAQSKVPVVIDAGLGTPSHAAAAMELGADAVLVNTAIAAAAGPVAMGHAFRLGVEAGRMAYESGLAAQSPRSLASATSPLTAFLAEMGA